MSIGRNMTILMYDKNVTQKDLAEHLDVSPTMISKYIKGIKKPSVERLVQIAERLDVTLDELVK